MKKKNIFTLILFTLLGVNMSAQEFVTEPLPFGDFEQWAVRYIKESSIMGGKTRILYAIAPTDTIYANAPFKYGLQGNPWSVSNAYAKVFGVEKASGTVKPEKRDDGYCCRMDVILDEVTILKSKTHVLVSGTIFTGKTIEPIRSGNDPYSNIDFGVPFNKKPYALQYDYKAVVEQSDVITNAKPLAKVKEFPGRDMPQVTIMLQKRWEDSDGNIYALRIGTAFERFSYTVQEWQNEHKTIIHYGDITNESFYKDYMGLNQPNRALNSKGKIVPVKEIGWGTENDMPTHAIVNMSSGHYEAFVGHEGNSFWVDNVKWCYIKQ